MHGILLTTAVLLAVSTTAARSQQVPTVKEESPGLQAKAKVTPA